jgi:hypothetical protein
MTELLKQKIDIKTVVTSIVFIVGLIANNIKNEYTQKLALKDLQINLHDQIKELENRINLIEAKK